MSVDKAGEMDELDALREAIGRQDWAEAAPQARALLEGWRAVKNPVLLFASEEAEASMKVFETVFVDLVEALEREPVDADTVDDAMAKVLAFLQPGAVGG